MLLGTPGGDGASGIGGCGGEGEALTREVASCLELMRATRAQLADRLTHSQATCSAVIADCHAASANCGSTGEGELTDMAAAAATAATVFGSPSAAPLQVRRQGRQGEEEEEAPVLSGSPQHDASNQQGTPSPSSAEAAPPPVTDARRVCMAARARRSGWDVAGFVRELGFEVRCTAVAAVVLAGLGEQQQRQQ